MKIISMLKDTVTARSLIKYREINKWRGSFEELSDLFDLSLTPRPNVMNTYNWEDFFSN